MNIEASLSVGMTILALLTGPPIGVGNNLIIHLTSRVGAGVSTTLLYLLHTKELQRGNVAAHYHGHSRPGTLDAWDAWYGPLGVRLAFQKAQYQDYLKACSSKQKVRQLI